MNTQYLKLNDEKIHLTNVNPEGDKLELSFEAKDKTLADVKALLTGLDNITIYSAIVQEDGRETDEITHMYFENFTKLSKIEYDLETESYKVVLVQPNILEERVTELEDAVNFLVMGGNE